MASLFAFCFLLILFLDIAKSEVCPVFINNFSACTCETSNQGLAVDCQRLNLTQLESLFQPPFPLPLPLTNATHNLTLFLTDFQDDFPQLLWESEDEVFAYLSSYLVALIVQKADSITRLPDLSFAINLTNVTLDGLTNLTHGNFSSMVFPSALRNLKIHSTRITHLNVQMLDALIELTSLEIVGQGNLELVEQPFAFSPSLQQLTIVGGLSALAADSLSGLDNLKVLNLSANNLDYLPDGLLDSLPSLETLDLSSNELSRLPRGLLANNTKLIHFTAVNNDISHLPADLFRHNSELRSIDLSSNRLYILQDGQFSRLPHLENLTLSNNRMSELKEGIFRYLTSLTHLDLSQNHLNVLAFDTFVGLENARQLNLSHNLLSGVDRGVFRMMTNVEHIDLSYNNLERFDGLVFGEKQGSRSRDLVLDLSHNKLQLLSSSFAEYFNGTKVVLSDNPLTCSCANLWLANVDWIEDGVLCLDTSTSQRRPLGEVTNENCVTEERRQFFRTNMEGFFFAGTIFFVVSIVLAAGIAFAFAARRHNRKRFYPAYFNHGMNEHDLGPRGGMEIKHISGNLLTTAL